MTIQNQLITDQDLTPSSYLKFRRIILDGERLQHNRDQLGKIVFQRRLTRLKKRLADLVNWSNPDSILEQIIKKEFYDRVWHFYLKAIRAYLYLSVSPACAV